MVGVKNKSEYLLTKGPVQLCLPSIRTNRDITGARHGHYTTERRNLDFPDLPCNSKHWIAWDEDGGSESEWGVWQWVLSLSWLQDHGCHLRRESQWGTGPGTHGLAARTPWEPLCHCLLEVPSLSTHLELLLFQKPSQGVWAFPHLLPCWELPFTQIHNEVKVITYEEASWRKGQCHETSCDTCSAMLQGIFCSWSHIVNLLNAMKQPLD